MTLAPERRHTLARLGAPRSVLWTARIGGRSLTLRSVVVLVADDRVLIEPRARVQDVLIGQPCSLALPVRRDLVDVAAALAVTVFEDAHDLVMKTAARAEGSHGADLTPEIEPGEGGESLEGASQVKTICAPSASS